MEKIELNRKIKKSIMTYLKIQNNGEIDLKAFSLIGASTKRDDNSKIGYFGSGLKYAIAVLLKNDIKFKIYSGLKEIKIGKKKEKFRDKEFEIITINGKNTNFTTDMGPSWKAWFAIREIYCNAIDESGFSNIEPVLETKPVKGKTIFYVEYHEELKELFTNWDNYFSDKRSDIEYSTPEVKLFGGGQKLIVYRKGVQCFIQDKKAIFHYDLDKVKINESRVLDGEWEFVYPMAKYFANITDEKIIKKLLKEICASYEKYFKWECVDSFSDAWLNVLGDKTLIPEDFSGHFLDEQRSGKSIILPTILVKRLKLLFGDKIKVVGIGDEFEMGWTPVKINEQQETILNQCLDFIEKGGVKVENKINFVDFNENKNVYGTVKNNQIYLSQKLFEHGKRYLIAVILEEYSHLDSGEYDKTRGFQNYLFNKIVVLMEEKTGIYL